MYKPQEIPVIRIPEDTTEQLAASYLAWRELHPEARIGFVWWGPREGMRCEIILSRTGRCLKNKWGIC